MTRHTFRTLSILIALFCLASTGLGQQPQYPYAVDTKPSRGLMPNSEQLSGSLDSIDPISGKLHIQIPLASLPAGNAGSGFDLSLAYDSHLFDLGAGEVAQDRVMQTVSSSLTGGGWHYNFQNYRVEGEQRYIPTWEQSECNRDFQYAMEHQRLYRYRISLPDGSQHILHLLGYGDEKGDGYYGDGFYAVNMDGIRSNCARQNPARYPADATGTLTYFTTDGSYLRFQINANGSPWFNQQWTLFYPDGRRVVGRFDEAQHIYDANGNGVHIAKQTENGHTVAYLTDDFNRSVRVEYSLTSSSTEKEDRITIVGPNGLLEWRVRWQRIQVGGPGATYICYIDDVLHPQYTTRCGLNFQYWVVKYVQLPIAAPDFVPPVYAPWKSFEFAYSQPGQGYGRLVSMRAPSGTSYTYCCDLYSPDFMAQDIAYAGYSSRTVTHDGAVDAWTYQTISNTSVRVTNPDGGQVTYHFYDPHVASEYWSRNLVYWIEEPDGTERKRQWTRNRVFSLRAAVNIDVNNAYIERESVTMDKVDGQPRASVTDYLIDKNGNSLQVKEYDWSTAFAGPTMESSGPLLRTTETSYYVAAPSSVDTGNAGNRYWNPAAPPRLNAVLNKTIRDGSGAPKAVTEYLYDDAFSKGNVKYQRHWDDATPGCVSSSPLDGVCPAQHREYDPTGNLIDIFEPEIRTHITYAGPYPTLVEYAPGTPSLRSFSYAWNIGSGVLNSQTDIQNGVVTGYGYDSYGRPALVDEANFRQTQTAYDDEQRTVTVRRDLRTQGDGALQTISHTDQLGRIDLVRTSDGIPLSPSGEDGIKVKSTYRTFPGGTEIITSSPYRATSDATLEWTCALKNQSGRVVTVSKFKGSGEPASCLSVSNRTGITMTEYHVSLGTPRTRVTDAAGKTVDHYVDGLGRLSSVVEDPFGFAYATTYEYDALGNLTAASQTDGEVSQQRVFTYSSLGRLNTASHPESGTIQFSYRDSGDLLTRSDDRGFTTTFDYDDLHRVRTKTYSGDGDVTPDVTFAYHNAAPCAGRLLSVASSAGATTYNSCDPLGRLLSETQSIAEAGSFDLSYTYWLSGALKTLTYPSGRVVHFDVDDAGRATKLYTDSRVYADLTGAAVGYAADGRITRLKLGNNLWETRNYQAPGTPTEFKLGTSEGAAERLELQYNFSASANNGNLLSHVIRLGTASWAQTYEYDGLNRLTCATETTGEIAAPSCSAGDSWSQTFGYDRFGNRWVSASAGFNFGDAHEFIAGSAIDRNSNRIIGSTYDAAGNQTLYTPWSLAYDAENRVLSATSASNGNSWFAYDGEGRRIKKVTATPDIETTLYVYDAAGHVVAEYSTRPSATGTVYLFSDLLGTSRAITDQDGAVVECSDYSPYGRLLQTPTRSLACHHPPNHASQQFTGKERDRETGLDWFGTRYLSAAQGRFTSPDSVLAKNTWLSEPQRWNRYEYALDNPLKFVDPDGKDAIAAFFLGEAYRDVSTWDVIFSRETVSQIRSGADQFFAEHRQVTHGLSPVPTTKAELGMQVVVPLSADLVGVATQKLLTNGRPLSGLLRAGRTVLGKVGKYEELADELGANKFVIRREVWEKMTHAERWAANKRFLDEAIKNGDEIILAERVRDIAKETGQFRKELDYLLTRGFHLSADGTKMIR